MNILVGYKTYITAALMLAIGVASLFGITIPGFSDPGTLITGAVGLIFARLAVPTAPTP